MTGRGRGRPPKSSPSPQPTDSAGGQQPGRFPAGAVASAGPFAGMPSFTTDILNQLPPPKQGEMLALVNRFKSKQISIQEFLGISKNLLGDRLYAVLAQGMSSAVRMPGAQPAGMPMQMPIRPGMPGMYPHPGMPPQMPGAGQAPIAALQQQQHATTDDVGDVTRLDAASLQDVIQGTGIDLRAEADLLDAQLQSGFGAGAGIHAQDARMRPEYYFNLMRMKAIVGTVAKARGIEAISSEVWEVLALALKTRLLNILTAVSEISKHRVDAGRVAFKIKVENDPKKQLWLLERVYEEQLEQQQEALFQGQSAKAGDAADKAKAKKAAGGEKKAGGGEDVIVKTRLANTTAMAALGLQQKSWMTAGIVGMQQQSSSKPAEPAEAGAAAGTETDAAAMENVKIPLHFSQAPSATPVTDRDLLLQVSQRTVSLKDLVFFCERDPHLARSPILLTLYDLSNF